MKRRGETADGHSCGGNYKSLKNFILIKHVHGLLLEEPTLPSTLFSAHKFKKIENMKLK
jgi:hypothetical protein